MRTVDDQIIEPVGYDFGFSRRTFFGVLGAGLIIAASGVPSFAQQRREGRGGRRESAPIPLDARLHIGKDGVITVLTGKVECGQGARAQITAAAAEELKLAVDQIRIVMADTALTPDDGITAGSRTTPSTLPAVRQACAAARKLLDDLSAKAGKPQTFAELAATSADALKQTASRDVQVIAVKDWKVLGKPVARANNRDIVTGVHQYPSDITRPGMLFGKILRAPSYGAKLTAIDIDAAKSIDGAIVVRDGDFIGVVAPTTYAARKAIEAIAKSAKWDAPPQPSSKQLFEHLRKNARDIQKNPFANDVKSASRSHRATYNVAYVQHAPMEPRSAVAEWDNGRLTVWTSTQNPFGVRRELAGTFHLAEDRVRVIVPDFGGGFGGKHTGETAVEAARLAQSAKKPVALHWTREEEFTWASFRPAAVIDLEASLDDEGALTSLHFIDINAGGSGMESPYKGKKETQFAQTNAPLRHGSYRALAGTANNFARESFIDELAHLAGKDPLEFRLANLEDDRVRAVLEEAAKQFKWTDRVKEKRENIGIGLACGAEKGSVVAACVEVEIVRETSAIKVRHVCQAFECGAITNPDNLRAQSEGSIIMALGPAFREAMEFESGKILNASFWKYEVPRFSDVPRIDVHLVNRPDLPPAGAGEIPLIAVTPAIANAVFRATGQRLREMPMRLANA